MAMPDVSNLNFEPGRNVPNLVVCKVGADGAVSLVANDGELDVIADVVGCFTAGGASVVPVAPARLLDTRHGHGARRGPVGPKGEIDLDVTGVGGVDPACDGRRAQCHGDRRDAGDLRDRVPGRGPTRPTHRASTSAGVPRSPIWSSPRSVPTAGCASTTTPAASI